MQFTGKESVSRGIVNGPPTGTSTRCGSYDLRVGEIIVSGEQYTDEFSVQPQQMVLLVSQETVEVPKGVVGYALPKTSLGQRGILALSTGVIDPGYKGLVSTAAINFDRQPYTIRAGDPFLRLVFHQLTGVGAEELDERVFSANCSSRHYTRQRIQDSIRYPDSFLDLPSKFEEVKEKIRKDLLNETKKWAIGALVTVVTVAGILSIANQWMSADRLLELETNAQQLGRLEALLEERERSIEALRTRVTELESNIAPGNLEDTDTDEVQTDSL